MKCPSEVLALASVCPPDGPSRWEMRQVRFGADAKGSYAVATDTRVLVVLRWTEDPDGEVCEFGVPARSLEALRLASLARLSDPRGAAAYFADDEPGGYEPPPAGEFGLERRPGEVIRLWPESGPWPEFLSALECREELGRFPPWKTITDGVDAKLAPKGPLPSGAANYALGGDYLAFLARFFRRFSRYGSSVRVAAAGGKTPVRFALEFPAGNAPMGLTAAAYLMPLAES
jgi:hypothetical protein